MKANELSVGDFVDIGYRPAKVLSVSSDGYVNVSNVYEEISIGYLKPIPITPEILEKNGFKQRYWNGMYYLTFDLSLNDNKERISVGLGRHCCYCRKKNAEYLDNEVEIHCEYVHELQHALRLCNIDKEIEL